MKITLIHNDSVVKISGKIKPKKAKKMAASLLNSLPPAVHISDEPDKQPIGFHIGVDTEIADESELL